MSEDHASLQRAKDQALRLLSVRARTVHEMHERLGRAGFSTDIAGQVVDWLLELGYLDDERFAQDWIEYRMRFKPKGRFALMQELRQKGISREVAERALAHVDLAAEVELARSLAAKRWKAEGGDGDEGVYRRAYASLTRRGFRPEAVRRALSYLDKPKNLRLK